LLLRIVQVKKE